MTQTRSAGAASLTHVPLATAAALSAIFLALLPLHPYPGSWLLKSSAILILAGLSWTRLENGLRVPMAAAFVFSAAGDVFLDVDRVHLFVPGLASFLVTHLFFISAFWKRRQITRARGFAAAAAFAYSGTMLSLLFPTLGPLTVPVFAYVLVLTTMGATALLLRRTTLLTPLGAVLFVLSDSMIAINKFLQPWEGFGPLIWITYAAGQLLIYRGLERDYGR